MIPNYDNLDQITPADIESLVGYREDGHLDFKVKPYTKDQSIEWLKDVCAFANSGGGAILIGLSDNDGKADRIKGLEPDTKVDSVTRSLAQRVNSQIKPSVVVRHRTVEFDDGREVLVYAIRGSHGGPCGFYDDRDNFIFWKRLETGSNSKMTHEDIRSAHLTSSHSIDRYAELHRSGVEHRIERFAGHPNGVYISMLTFPERGEIIKMENYNDHDLARHLVSLQSVGGDYRMTFEYFEVHSPTMSQVLLRRNGDMRSFLVYQQMNPADKWPELPSHAIVEQWRQAVIGHAKVCAAMGISGPWVGCTSMYGFKNYRLGRLAPTPLGNQLMHFPPMLVEDTPDSRASLLGGWADRLWQAGGSMRCDLIRRGAEKLDPQEMLSKNYREL